MMRHWSGYKNWQTHAIMTWDIIGQDLATLNAIEDTVHNALMRGPNDSMADRYLAHSEWLLQEVGRIIKEALEDDAMLGVFSHARVSDDARWVEDMWRGTFDDVAWTEIAIASIKGSETWANASEAWQEEIDRRYKIEHGRGA
jgi:hypothetical protein